MDIKDINFAIDILSHPQSGDASDIKEAFKVAIESLKAWKGALKQEPCEDCISRILEQIDKAYAYFESGDIKHGFDICKDIINKYRESEVKV